MVSSLFTLTDLLSEMGHQVFVTAEIERPDFTDHGVYWGNLPPTPPVGQEYDFLILNRGVGDGYPQIKSKHRILWTHDLPHNGFIPNPLIMGAFSATVFMSEYAERVWRAFYRTIKKSFTIPNGVDKSRFYPRENDLSYLIYASAPNRGLRRLPLIFQAIKNRAERAIYMRAYSNMAAQHPNEVRNGDRDGWQEIYHTIRESPVELHDPVPQHELAEEFGRAGLMILPTEYPEICSNTILQALASGVPIVTTGNLGSAGEWIKHGRNGMLTQFLPTDYMIHQLEIVRGALEILNNEPLHLRMIRDAVNTKILTWEEVARKWDKMFRRLY